MFKAVAKPKMEAAVESAYLRDISGYFESRRDEQPPMEGCAILQDAQLMPKCPSMMDVLRLHLPRKRSCAHMN